MALTDMVSPVGEAPPSTSKLAPPVQSLEGKVVGLDDTAIWYNFDPFLDKLEEIIQARYHPKAIVRSEKGHHYTQREEALGRFAEQVDCAINGLAA